MRLLFVCTGNLCRSPIAERMTVAWAQQSLCGSPELTRVEILSAGTRAATGRPMDAGSAAALQRLGGSPEDFLSRPLTRELLESADLVLTMTRTHRREALKLAPRGLRKTFTVNEAAGLLPCADLRGLRTMPLTARARELGRRLDAARSHGAASDADDVADPVGRRPAVHEEVARQVAVALRPLADVLLASVRMQPALATSA